MSISKVQHEALRYEMRRATQRVVEVAIQAHPLSDRIRILREVWATWLRPGMGQDEAHRELGG